MFLRGHTHSLESRRVGFAVHHASSYLVYSSLGMICDGRTETAGGGGLRLRNISELSNFPLPGRAKGGLLNQPRQLESMYNISFCTIVLV